MADSFFFYDLETSGVNPRHDRIMQFAGQRTDTSLKPIGKPYNILIKMTKDVLPQPDAILVTGITPQMTLAEGISEAEFARLFYEEIASPDTVFVGFNNIRFDDEFMRFLFWRNFTDAYEWQWKNGRSRWDVLDLSRITRALRPEGIKWPFDSKEGKPTNQLELLASANNLVHTKAHDAMSDVEATISVAKLIKAKQPKLFDFLLSSRSKQSVRRIALGPEPFVYSSGKYPGQWLKTTIVASLGLHPDNGGALVYDLRHDPDEFTDKTPEQLAQLWRYDKKLKAAPLPVKNLSFNRCPAIAPISVLDTASQKRLSINLKQAEDYRQKLAKADGFYDKLIKATRILNAARSRQQKFEASLQEVDSSLYDNFVSDKDKPICRAIRTAEGSNIIEAGRDLSDERLKQLVHLYKARNFKQSLSDDEVKAWNSYRQEKLTAGGDKSQLRQYFNRLEELASYKGRGRQPMRLLDQLRLYGQHIGDVNLN